MTQVVPSPSARTRVRKTSQASVTHAPRASFMSPILSHGPPRAYPRPFTEQTNNLGCETRDTTGETEMRVTIALCGADSMKYDLPCLVNVEKFLQLFLSTFADHAHVGQFGCTQHVGPSTRHPDSSVRAAYPHSGVPSTRMSSKLLHGPWCAAQFTAPYLDRFSH